jgi:hypothetical protein
MQMPAWLDYRINSANVVRLLSMSVGTYHPVISGDVRWSGRMRE